MDKEIIEVLKNIQGDIKEIQGDINGMKSDIKWMKGDINGMKGDINGMKGDIEELKTGQDRIEKKIDKTFDYLEVVDAKQATNHLQLVSKFSETNTKIDLVQVDVNNIGAKVYNCDNKIIEIDRKLNIVK